MFAKVFDSESRGQLLAMRCEGNEGPELRVFCQPPGLGVCSVALGFSDDEIGYDRSHDAFEKIDIESAERLVSDLYRFAEGEHPTHPGRPHAIPPRDPNDLEVG